MIDESTLKNIVAEVAARVACGAQPASSCAGRVPVEVSARHVHLTQQDVEALFGPGHTLTPKRALSQPGEFLCEERVKLVTPKGELANVAVLGPARKATQVELSLTDARALGVKAPVNLSGDLTGAGDVYLVSERAMLDARACVIAARNHIHMTVADAARFGVRDGALVNARIQSARPLTFENVVVRVRDSFALAMHIDFDEANACAFETGASAEITCACGALSPQGGGIAAQALPAAPSCTRFEEPLVTEAAARALCEKRLPVVLKKGVILTPSARDVFRAARIDFCYED